MPYIHIFDGPLTVAVSLFGESILLLLMTDPDKCRRLFAFMTEAIIARRKAQHAHFGVEPDRRSLFFADDSVQMISEETYREVVLPSHRMWYEQYGREAFGSMTKLMHLCGDSTRHFATIHRELGVSGFDTGYPVDHGALRRTLGPYVEIFGGPKVGLLRHGTPEECAATAREILESGVKEGGRFIMQEGNNLPPGTPLENMAAVYETVLEYGNY